MDELQDGTGNPAHDRPVVLIGHSWGAWFSWFVAASYPQLVGKLILIGTPAFEENYVPLLRENRLRRLTAEEQQEFSHLGRPVDARSAKRPNASLSRLGDLAAKADTYDPMALDVALPSPSVCEQAGAIYEGVWPAAAAMRRTGDLLALTARIACRVIAIHGDRDPIRWFRRHPADRDSA